MGQIDWNRCGTIAELGAGTGVFTRGIAHHRMPEAKVLVFERDDALRQRLTEEFPQFVLCPDALLLSQALGENAISSLDYVVSGLPFANFPRAARNTIFEQINKSLKPDGYFILFQYSLMLRTHLNDHFHFVSSKLVRFNFPPAYVLVYRKRD
ncbi:MAG: class I SAM-dependent methyltransferase [Candidatus Methylacidiphilales bacterium]|nr:methyltransferase domain-containing protein [Candidatus Methylacidiphilales bacterium]